VHHSTALRKIICMKRNRILVVDDEENLRRVIEVQLEQEGYQVETAADGKQALTLLAQSTFALVLTDLRMPGISGMDLLKEIRKAHPQVMVIILTAFGTIETA